MKELWVEKYPNTVDGYVFRDDAQKQQVKQWIADGTIPHLLFSGNAGIGKTTLAKILLNQLEVNDLDVLEINASRTNSVEDVRDKIVNFVQMIPFGAFKVVLLDEADYLSSNAQAPLRGVMEEYLLLHVLFLLVTIPIELFHYTVDVRAFILNVLIKQNLLQELQKLFLQKVLLRTWIS